MKYRYILVVGFCLLRLGLFGQVTFQVNFDILNGTSDYGAHLISVDSGLLFHGPTICEDPSNGIYQCLPILKTDMEGNLKWQKIFGNYPDFTGAAEMLLQDNGDVIIAGAATLNGNLRPLLLRIDESGDTVWVRQYDDPEKRVAIRLAQLPDGNIMVYGTGTYDFASQHIWLMKVNGLGGKIWDTVVQNGFNTSVGGNFGVIQPEEDIVMGYRTEKEEAGNHIEFAAVTKTNPFGDTLWTKTFDELEHHNPCVAKFLVNDENEMILSWCLDTIG